MISCKEKFIYKKYAMLDEKSQLRELQSKQLVRKSWLKYVPFIAFIAVNLAYLHCCMNEVEFSIGELTDKYLNVLQTSNQAREILKFYTEEPHLAGDNLKLVNYTADSFEKYGFTSKVEPFNVYLNYPTSNYLKLFSEDGEFLYQPTLVEDVLKKDNTTDGDDLIPAFHGYSANGNVTGPLVYANYGRMEDFRLLKEHNVAINGSIVLVRYGEIYRGLKVKFAQEFGAVGVVIYTDPADDLIYDEKNPVKAYPDGPGRNPSSIQRGSVQFLSYLPGDPARFLSDEQKLDPDCLGNLSSIPQIPSVPISFKEAEPILKQLNGYGLDLGFSGGIKSFKYTTGPSAAKLNLFNDNEYVFTDIYNVYGYHEGEDKDSVILLGNHRDAWIKGGAGDPNSGSALILEVARALNELFELGWKPKTSIMLASWDGEEYGLVGSTAFGEKYSEVLGKKVVGYLNVDVAVTGSHFHLNSSPLINEFLLKNAALISHPNFSNETLRSRIEQEGGIEILGSGSDYTVFYEHLGITSVDISFATGENDPVYHYHSNYDSFHWMDTFADPGFKLHNSLAQYVGLLVLNLSENKLLTSFKLHDFASSINQFYTELIARLPVEEVPKGSALYDEIKHTKKLIKKLIHKSYGFDAFVKKLQFVWDNKVSKSKNPIKKFFFNRKVAKVNSVLRNFEKQFIYEEGLNNRDWFKHIVFASGRFTGYAGQALPGLTEAIEDEDLAECLRWIKIIGEAVESSLDTIDFGH